MERSRVPPCSSKVRNVSFNASASLFNGDLSDGIWSAYWFATRRMSALLCSDEGRVDDRAIEPTCCEVVVMGCGLA